MKLSKFIEDNQIKPALVVGFKDYLRRDPEQEFTEEFLKENYEKFSGRKLEKVSPSASKPTVPTNPDKPGSGASGDKPDGTDKPGSNQDKDTNSDPLPGKPKKN